MPLEDLVHKPIADAEARIKARFKTLLTHSEWNRLSQAEKAEAGTLYDYINAHVKWALTSTNTAQHGDAAGDLWSHVNGNKLCTNADGHHYFCSNPDRKVVMYGDKMYLKWDSNQSGKAKKNTDTVWVGLSNEENDSLQTQKHGERSKFFIADL